MNKFTPLQFFAFMFLPITIAVLLFRGLALYAWELWRYQEKIEIYKSIKKMEEENEKDRYGK